MEENKPAEDAQEKAEDEPVYLVRHPYPNRAARRQGNRTKRKAAEALPVNNPIRLSKIGKALKDSNGRHQYEDEDPR